MKDLRQGIVELFEEAAAFPRRNVARAFAERARLPKRRRAESSTNETSFRRKVRAAHAVAIPPLPCPVSCRFCRRGVHCLQPHVGSCRQAPPWARRAGGGAPEPKAETLELWEATV